MGSPLLTPEIRAQVKSLWEAGNSYGVIAKKLGRTRNVIIGLVTRMKLPKRPTNIVRPSYHSPRPKPKQAPPPPLSADPIAIGPLNTFPDTSSCRYIAVDVSAGDWRCCGLPIDRHSLCTFHAARCRLKPLTRAR